MRDREEAWCVNFLIGGKSGAALHFQVADEFLRIITMSCEGRDLQVAGSYRVPRIRESPENTVEMSSFLQKSVLDTSRPLRLAPFSGNSRQDSTESPQWLFRLVVESSKPGAKVGLEEIEDLFSEIRLQAEGRHLVAEGVIQRPKGTLELTQALLDRIDEIGAELEARKKRSP